MVVILVLAILSHFPVDLFVKITFHTPEPHPKWPFWVVHIASFSVAGFITVLLLWTPYWWTMLAANLVDIWDWLILRPYQSRRRKKNPEFSLQKYMVHTYIERLRDKYFTWVPEWWYKPKGVIPEIILDVIGFLILFLM